MTAESDRANQQFVHAKKRSAEIVHQQMADAVRKQHEDTIAINNSGGYGVPGFTFVHTTHRSLELTDPHALDDLVEP